MATATSTVPYTGPSAPEMIQSHTLAKEIMARHGSDQAVFDEENIVMLRAFIADPTAYRTAVLAAQDTTDAATGSRKVVNECSLVDYMALVHGTDKATLTEDEFAALQAWFADGIEAKE